MLLILIWESAEPACMNYNLFYYFIIIVLYYIFSNQNQYDLFLFKAITLLLLKITLYL